MTSGQRRLRTVWWVLISVAMIPLLVPSQWATAEAASAWSTPTVLFETSGYTSNPVLVPDSTGDVHLVFWVSEKKAFNATSASVLMYARLHQGTWSSAADVLTAPDGGQLKQPAAAIDDAGFLHVVFVAGAQGDVYYSRVHVSEADQTGTWTRPALLSLSAASNGAFGVPAAIDASGGTLHFVYTSREGKLVYRRSNDGGISWSSALTLSDDSRSGRAADDPRLISDGQGRVFVTWSQFQLPAGWPPTGTYMTMSPDNGITWSQGLRVSGENRGLLNLAGSATGQLYRLWLSIGELGEKKGQFSNDGGETWSLPESVAPGLGGGLTGFPPMAYDSAGVLHIAPSATGASKNGIYHLTWDGRFWSQPTFVSKGAVGRSSVELPAMAVSRGNQIHIVYEDDFARIWYTSQLSNAPQTIARPIPAPPLVAPVPSPLAAATPTPRPTPTPTPVPPSDPVPEQNSAETQLDTSSGLRRALLTGAAPVVLILGGLLFQRLRRIV